MVSRMSKAVRIALITLLLASLLLILLVGPARDPNLTSPKVYRPPSREHWLGTAIAGEAHCQQCQTCRPDHDRPFSCCWHNLPPTHTTNALP